VAVGELKIPVEGIATVIGDGVLGLIACYVALRVLILLVKAGIYVWTALIFLIKGDG